MKYIIIWSISLALILNGIIAFCDVYIHKRDAFNEAGFVKDKFVNIKVDNNMNGKEFIEWMTNQREIEMMISHRRGLHMFISVIIGILLIFVTLITDIIKLSRHQSNVPKYIDDKL